MRLRGAVLCCLGAIGAGFAGAVVPSPAVAATPHLTPAATAAPAPLSLSGSAQGTQLKVSGRLAGAPAPAAPLTIWWDDVPVGHARLDASSAFSLALTLPTPAAGGDHRLTAQVSPPGRAAVRTETTVTASAAVATSTDQVRVQPASAQAGDRVTVTARVLDQNAKPLGNVQVAVDPLDSDGYTETGWTDGQGVVSIPVEVPRGTRAATLPVVVAFLGDDTYRPSSARTSLTVVAGGLPAAKSSAQPGSAATPVAPDPVAPGATVITPPRPSATPVAPPAPANRDALPFGFKAGLGVLALLGLVVSFAAGARASAPHDGDDYDRFIG